MEHVSLETTCCIVGGGPAGLMAGYLLARAGVQVVVLEKHGDFNRDFRGDTVHPSTLQVFHELGLLDKFLQLPHQELTSASGVFGDYEFHAANFSQLPTVCKFVALMPQWDFLNFLAGEAKRFPAFDLRMEHQATGLMQDGDRITGVVARTADGNEVRITADLVIGCDGRHSVTRDSGHFEVKGSGVPIDVLWFRLKRRAGDPEQLLGRVNYGRALILINRGDYFQSGLIIPKGSFPAVQEQGLNAFRKTLRTIAPFLEERADDLTNWDQIKLLTVQINGLRTWRRPGLLCIGDAAHAMSPAGGVGINLAIQDAVATANLLAGPLREKRVTENSLASVQARREFPTRATQFMQTQAHRGLARIFEQTGPLKAPWQLKAVTSIPGVQHLMGRMIGMGFRPEHVGAEGRLRRLAIRTGSAAGELRLMVRRALRAAA